MEKWYKQILQERFNEVLIEKGIVVLDIEVDNYQYMDGELIETLRTVLALLLK
jgi:predicted protein tyrosine phosphatase